MAKRSRIWASIFSYDAMLILRMTAMLILKYVIHWLGHEMTKPINGKDYISLMLEKQKQLSLVKEFSPHVMWFWLSVQNEESLYMEFWKSLIMKFS